jgi:hypothetical protein
MSVVAGCSLFKGVLLIADCRVTVMQGSDTRYVDNVQKLFPLTPTTAIGFVGNIELSALILKGLFREIKRKAQLKKLHPVSLIEWLPRYLRFSYGKLADKNESPQVAFMVASVIRSLPNAIERSKVVQIMERFRLGQLSAGRNWLPEILIKILKMPESTKVVRLLDSPLGLLYSMASPDFTPQHSKPLEFCAIGSGKPVTTQIDYNLDWIFAGEVGNPSMEASALGQCVANFIRDYGIESVGGLLPCLRVDADGVSAYGLSVEMPVGGTKIELAIDQKGRWTQRNLSTGKEMALLYPWEITLLKLPETKKFDDLDEAMSQFRGCKVD